MPGSGADAATAVRLGATNTGRVAGMLLSNGETGNLPSASECLVSKRAEVQAKNSISISYSALPAPASNPLYSAESAAGR